MEIVTRIPDEVLEVMQSASVEGDCLKLATQLDRKLYVAVDKVLKGMGGKWDRRRGGHVFADNPERKLAAVLNSGQLAFDSKNGFFETPRHLVDWMIKLARIEDGERVLEPSAGKGAIADRIQELYPNAEIICVEQNAERASILLSKGHLTWHRPFEEFDDADGFDRVVMNPPFQCSLDARHVLRAYEMLRPGGILVSICGAGVQFRKEKVYEQVRSLASSIEDLPADTFKESGTRVNTCLLTISKR